MNHRRDRDRWRGSFLIVLLLGSFFSTSGCAVKGAELFRSEGCITCHRFNGEGGNVCPDLTGVSNRRSDEWIAQQLKDSRKNNPSSRMPSFSHLSFWQVRSIIQYLKSD